MNRLLRSLPHVFRPFAVGLAGLLIACLLAGCLAPYTPAQESSLPVADWFPNQPKAQALAVASEFGRLEEVRRLMKAEGVDPDKIFSPEGYPLLAWPVITESPEGLREMLKNGADPNAMRRSMTTDRGMRNNNNAMVWAAKAKDPIYLKILLDHGGDPNTRNSNDETLLEQSILGGGGWPNVKLLVERGADVNARSKGSTILADFAGLGGFQQVLWLLEHGADPTTAVALPPDIPPERTPVIENIFWYPSKPGFTEWQKKCQQWLLAHGYNRPPMPDRLRRMRKAFGYPDEEKDIPLL
ncbi:ankyrin repeat domain-containing protein [Lysobacter sp. BMK333-48F3]|uniref:ankyrin repeat domain-containing protein n=1 Tax=Lysobacter sp. BMK333-48F3 TaxID=2867962 RepID=UPI001C8B3740|nr:ankyrin repeat domain-containing protein [Lysobacter sp. BMK333-48F3]MBX9402261.1 ankyrin repeat domain-containing protein [Lysobacter sp. BMK333-48F3]